MSLLDPLVARHVERLRTSPEAVSRDARMARICLVRAGNLDLISPDAFSDEWPKPVIANFIDSAARDLAETLGPLPTLTCSSGKMNSELAKKKATIRGRIGANYWNQSRLKVHSVRAADWFFSYGFLPVVVEPDVEAGIPRIRFENPVMAYPDCDRFGNVRAYCKVMRKRAGELAVLWPEHASKILASSGSQFASAAEAELEVVRFSDKDRDIFFLPGRDRTLLIEEAHGLSRVPVVVATRGSLDEEWRGQYDDAIWVQLARAKLASLALEAGMKAVEAPIAVPQDMVEMPIGPDAVWRTDSPQNIRRINLEVPASVWGMDQRLEMEQMRSTRYPEARSGSISASVITGRGVQELMGSFDSQIKAAQDQFGHALAEATSLAFEMDECLFGAQSKTIAGVSAGAPFRETYSADKAIAGDYTCDVSYGMLAGLAPNNAAVMMLQLLGAELVSKEAVMKQLPFDVDPVEMSAAIAVERAREALLQGVAGLAQSIPAAAQVGQDPLMIVHQLGVFLKKVRAGASVEDATEAAFTPPPPSPEQQAAMAAQAAGAPGGGGGGLPPGMGPDGTMSGVAPGQQGMAPGGLPDLSNMVASFSRGQADMSASVSRRRAV